MFDLNALETKFAIQTVRQACQLIKLIQAEMVTPALTKQDRSPVTVADFASQALVGKLLADYFPGDPLVGEEDSTALQQPEERHTLEQVTHYISRVVPNANPGQVCAWIDRGGAEPAQRFWTLDPIDGTKGFLRGDQYAVALALIVEGQVQMGVLGCPNLADGYWPELDGPGSLGIAVRGAGAWIGPLAGDEEILVPLHVSERIHPDQARILRSFESGHTNVSQIDLFAEALGVQAEAVRMDSQAKYLVLAAGEGELYLRLLSPKQPDYKEKIWDQAAGSLLVEEAGGRVSDLQGKELDFAAGRQLLNNHGLLASNAQLHPAALQALRTIQA
jgi:3'(2'), 5'-bisphosphate nucleotidase